jgi:hypothetical protein
MRHSIFNDVVSRRPEPSRCANSDFSLAQKLGVWVARDRFDVEPRHRTDGKGVLPWEVVQVVFDSFEQETRFHNSASDDESVVRQKHDLGTLPGFLILGPNSHTAAVSHGGQEVPPR